jgi:hypothetical protein
MDRVPEFWRVFGPGFVVAAALTLLTLFNATVADITQLRREIDQERTARARLVSRADLVAAAEDPAARLAAVENAIVSMGRVEEDGSPDADAEERQVKVCLAE